MASLANPQVIERVKLEAGRQICVLRFSPSGQTLVGGSYDGLIRRWSFPGEASTAMLLPPPGLLVGSVSEQRVADRWKSIAPLTSMQGHAGWVQTLDFGPDGRFYSADSWGKLCCWHDVDGEPEVVWSHQEAHSGWIRNVAVSADGSDVLSVGRNGQIKVWETATGKLKHAIQTDSDLYCGAMHPAEESLVTASLLGEVVHWDLTTGKPARSVKFDKMHFYERIQDVAGIRVLRFSPDGQTLFCAGSEPTRSTQAMGVPTVHQLSWSGLKVSQSQRFGKEREGFILDLAIHPDGYLVMVSSGTPGAGQFLMVNPDQPEAWYNSTKMSNCHCLALHPNGKAVVVSATNRNSQGNGAVVDKQGNYLGNTSPIHVFEIVAAQALDRPNG